MTADIDYASGKVETAVSGVKSLKWADRLWKLVLAVAAAGVPAALFPSWVVGRLMGVEWIPAYLPTAPDWIGPALHAHPFVVIESAAVAFAAFAACVFFLRRRWEKLKFPFVKRKPGGSGLHGTAQWAEWPEICEMALLPPKAIAKENRPAISLPWRPAPEPPPEQEGVFIGAYEHADGTTHYLRHNGPEHVLAFAPTRSGKGVGLVLPTLYSWKASALVHDPKGEAWALTSGYRHGWLKQNTYNFDPSNADTTKVAAFNPLAEVRIHTTHDVADAQNIGTILADPEGKGLKDHWDKTGQSLISAVILHICYAADREHERPGMFSEVVEFLSKGELVENLEAMRDYPHRQDGSPHPMIQQEAESMLKKEVREQTSVASTAISYVTLYRDPVIAANTSRSDWRIRDLMRGDRPATAYLVVRPADAERLRPMMRMIATQIVRQLTAEMEFKDGRALKAKGHRLLLLDEFTALKKLTVIEEALAYMAGYGIKSYLIVQDIEQLKSVYGREETVISNCHVRVCFAPNKHETAEAISKMAGTRTVVHKAAKDKADKHAQTYQETSRPLITPDEVARLRGALKDAQGNIQKAGDLLVFVSGFRPIYGRQVMYFMDPRLRERSLVPPPKLDWGHPGQWVGREEVDGETPRAPAPEPTWLTEMAENAAAKLSGWSGGQLADPIDPVNLAFDAPGADLLSPLPADAEYGEPAPSLTELLFRGATVIEEADDDGDGERGFADAVEEIVAAFFVPPSLSTGPTNLVAKPTRSTLRAAV